MCTINTHICVIVMMNMQFKYFISFFKQNLVRNGNFHYCVRACARARVCARVRARTHNIFVTNLVLHILKNIRFSAVTVPGTYFSE
jgi:hypothetical protein